MQPMTPSQWQGMATTALTTILCYDSPHHHPPAVPQTFTEISSTSQPCAGSPWREGQDGGSAQPGSESHKRTTSLGSLGVQEGATAVGKKTARYLTQEGNLSPTRNLSAMLGWALDSPEHGNRGQCNGKET